MSIKTDSNGNQYVDVDLTTDIQKKLWSADSINERRRIAYYYIMGNLRGEYPTNDGRTVSINQRSANELTHGAPDIRIKVIPELVNIIKAGNRLAIKDAVHKQFSQFAYYDVLLKVGDEYYTANINIGIRKSGESVLYQINQFDEKATPSNIGRVRGPAPEDGVAYNDRTVEKLKSAGQLTDADREAGIQVPITDFNNKILHFMEKVKKKTKNLSTPTTESAATRLTPA